VRSLLNKEDPVGLVNRKPPHVLILSDDFGRQKDLGILRAIQRYRGSGMRVIGLFEAPEEAAENRDLCDFAFAPPWKTAEVRELLGRFFTQLRGEPPAALEPDGLDHDDA
jgi:hypothetical protein